VRIFISTYLILQSFLIQAQGSEWLNYFGFKAYQLNNLVQVDFGIEAGASCNGARLQRLNSSGNFENINEITGVCGGSEFPEYYSFQDENPIPYRLNTYRIEFGFQQGFSRTLEINFIPLTDGLSIYPNPAYDTVNLQFENPLMEEVEIHIYSIDAKILKSLNKITVSNVDVDVSDWKAGTYVFLVKVGDQAVRSSRFKVLRR
jgi:hypothetical protein